MLFYLQKILNIKIDECQRSVYQFVFHVNLILRESFYKNIFMKNKYVFFITGSSHHYGNHGASVFKGDAIADTDNMYSKI